MTHKLLQLLKKYGSRPEMHGALEAHFRLLDLQHRELFLECLAAQKAPRGKLIKPPPVNAETISQIRSMASWVDPVCHPILALDAFGTCHGANDAGAQSYQAYGLSAEWPTPPDLSMLVPEDREPLKRFLRKTRGRAGEHLVFRTLHGLESALFRFRVGDGSLYLAQTEAARLQRSFLKRS